jgi:hypothetical protein
MINYSTKSFLLAICAIAAGASSAAYGATYTVINYLPQYSQPGPLVEGAPGLFYFIAIANTAQPNAMVSVTIQGTTTTLGGFADPPYTLESQPATAANGLVYSSVEQTINGGSGNLFSVGPTVGTESTYPATALAPGPLTGNLPDGKLYGLSYSFSTGSDSLATVDLIGNVTPLYQFSGAARPGPPLYHADGNYYGIAGLYNATPFYRVTPSGSFTQIASLPFITDGFAGGTGVLVQATDGNFYGIQPCSPGCSSGNQHGAVFKLTPSGQFTILHDFGPCETVNSLIQGSDGNLYGTTQAKSILFSLTTSGVYKAQLGMNGADGLCPCYLTQGSDGIIYGSTSGGGATGGGVIFAFNAGLPVPKPLPGAFTPVSGAVGSRIRIWGYNLFGASVQFNGVPAATTSNSGPNYVWVIVPEGATTGPITVTTPGGAATTRESFTVN